MQYEVKGQDPPEEGCSIFHDDHPLHYQMANFEHDPQTLSLEKPVMQKKEKHSRFLYFSGVHQVKGRKYHTCSTNKLYEESVT